MPEFIKLLIEMLIKTRKKLNIRNPLNYLLKNKVGFAFLKVKIKTLQKEYFNPTKYVLSPIL